MGLLRLLSLNGKTHKLSLTTVLKMLLRCLVHLWPIAGHHSVFAIEILMYIHLGVTHGLQ